MRESSAALAAVGTLALAGVWMLAASGTGGAATGAEAAPPVAAPAGGAPTCRPTTSPHAFALRYDVAGFLAPGERGPSPGFGPTHDLDNESAPRPGPYCVVVGGTPVTFLFPQTRTPPGGSPPLDVLEVAYGSTVTVAAPPGNYGHVYVLAGVANGPEPAEVTLAYSDGSRAVEVAGFDDWCTVQIGAPLQPHTSAAWQGRVRILQSDGSEQAVLSAAYNGPDAGCGLYVTVVPADPDKALSTVTIANSLPAVPPALAGVTGAVNRNSRIGVVAISAR